MSPTDKKILRRRMRSERQTLQPDNIAAAAQAAAAHLIQLPAFLDATTVGCYYATDGEIDPAPLAHIAAKLGKSLFLPVCPLAHATPLSFYPYAPGDTLVPAHHDIHEPETQGRTPIAPEDLDLVLVPMVAFDENGERIGRGAGHFDVTFAFKQARSVKRPVLMGLAYEFQKVPPIAPNPWDVPMDFVATEKTLYCRGG